MKMIFNIVFENLLGKKDIETLITSQNCFKTSSLIYKCIEKYVSQEYNDEHYYLIISKLFCDSIDNLHEDSIELLTMKHQNKFDYFQSKKAIAEYLPQVKIMCSVRVGYQSETSSSDTTSDIFTTDTETKENIKPKKKTIKNIEKEIKKPLHKQNKINMDDEQSLVQDIKSKKLKEEYSQVEFNEEDNKLIDALFFD